MKVHLSATELCLSPRQTLSLVDAAGVRITAYQGSLWLTQDHDVRDIVLRAGESFTVDAQGVVIVQALDAARIGLGQPRPRPALSQAAARWLRQLGAAFMRPQLGQRVWS
jgi:hypothetical protein